MLNFIDCDGSPGMKDWSGNASRTRTAAVSMTSTLMIICALMDGLSMLVAVTVTVYNPGDSPIGIGNLRTIFTSPYHGSKTGEEYVFSEA